MSQGWLLVGLSIAVLLAAPLVAQALALRPSLAALLDSFVLVTVGGIVALHVVPQSAGLVGAGAVLAAAVGLFLPILLHRLDASALAAPKSAGRAARDVVLLVAFVAGVFVHGMFDGTALKGDVATPALALGVLLHRLPVGLALWIVVRPKIGVWRMLIVVAAYAGGTITGGALGGAVLTGASIPFLALLQAFVGGSILHIVAEAPPYRPHADGATVSTTSARAFGLAGAALAGVTLWALELTHDEHGASFGLAASTTFVTWAFVTAPATLLSFLLVGVLTALYPDGAPPLSSRGNRILDAAVGVAAGLPHPLCSCTVPPLYTTLVERGTSPAGARAFLVAAPELGVPAVFLSTRLLGLPFTCARVVGAALLALMVGASARGERGPSAAEPSGDPLAVRLRRGIRHGVVDAVDHVAPWIVLGLGVAALLEPALREPALASVPPGVQTAVLAVAALPLYLCAAGATPVAAMLLHKGASCGAVLAFLLVGPATSMPTIALLKRLHGARAAGIFAACVVGGACALGVLVDALFPSFPALIDLHASAARGPSVLEVGALVVVVGLVGASLVRQGVRGFLVQIMSPQHTHAADHDHGPGCGHDHGPPVAPDAVRITLSFDPRGGSAP